MLLVLPTAVGGAVPEAIYIYAVVYSLRELLSGRWGAVYWCRGAAISYYGIRNTPTAGGVTTLYTLRR